MRILCILGTRPEIIRLSQIIPKLDKVCELILLDTGQSFDANMSQVFYDELRIRNPDVQLHVGGKPGIEQVGEIINGTYQTIRRTEPDRMLVLGDTNSGLSAYAAARCGVPVYHMESGNRCFSDIVPEEINRRVIDDLTTVWMPYTERSRQNLLAEGKPSNRVFVTGNPIYEVMESIPNMSATPLLASLNVTKPYVLVTAHRQENVDNPNRLANILKACLVISKNFNVIFSRHPRTTKNMGNMILDDKAPISITFHEPFGLCDFLTLERNAKCIITDSGTVAEESVILGVPSVVIRDVTERPETIECGGSILSGVDPDSILRCFKLVTESPCEWQAPPEYLRMNVSDTVVRIVTGV